ncbi:hypothetical protein [Paenibacillus sp. FSL E2-0178]|uniref:hypothetical protein n=1 Tax=Paenibacillus sp. FSL E2-0178 TaxID=2921361 RepID=UPI003159473C
MNNKTAKIQLATYNQFGEFSFYVEREQIQSYLDSKLSEMEVDKFLETCTFKDTRMLFDWIKENSVRKATEQEEE